MRKRVLILSDGKLGHQNQSVRLAEKLNVEYDILTLERRKFVKLFSYIFPSLIIKNSRALKKQICDIKYDGVIGLGTVPRLAMVWLKKNNPKLKTICIMDPKINYNSYDVIVAPNHDEISYQGKNVVNITGSLSYFQKSDLESAKQEFAAEFSPLIKNPLVGLIVGGNANCYDFTMAKTQDLMDKTLILSQKLGSKIYATTSRRTPLEQTKYIKDKMLKAKNPIYTLEGPNPFRAIMAYSSVLVVTPETVSMLMESCATEALVLIADKEGVKSKRIQKFIQELIDKGMLHKLDDVLKEGNLEELIEKAKSKPKFNELEKVVEFIKSRNIL